MIICPGCSKRFSTYKALTCHADRCKSMAGVVTTAAKHYTELDGSRKRCKTSAPASDDEEQGDTEAIDFEVCFNNFGHLC